MSSLSPDASIEQVKKQILHTLSSAGQEVVLLEQVQRSLQTDPKTVSSALRELLESRQVNLSRGNGAAGPGGGTDTRTYLSLVNNLSESVSLVLGVIRASDRTGVDQAQISSRLRMSRTDVLKALQTLLAQKHIQERRSFANRAKRIYLMPHIEPSEGVTGGTLYCGEELDVAFVDELRRRIVAYVFQKHSATMEEILRFVEGETTVGQSRPINGEAPESPVTLIESRHYNSKPSPGQLVMTDRNISPRDVEILVQSLILDGVFDDVQTTLGAVPVYRLATGHNVIRHFTCVRKQPSKREKRKREDTDKGVIRDESSRNHQTGPLGRSYRQDGSGIASSELYSLMSEESQWEPACVSRPSAGLSLESIQDDNGGKGVGCDVSDSDQNDATGWAYMPAVGFPCLGCPQLSNCSVTEKGLIDPKQCFYLREWLS
ncbi:unnamed protein product [Phytomonas sp. Hart1]|nr:unnamed protein product [Phytomonas sp. Hart1]|eukprot:CCW67375.1 unnamed protein product [Phytomonas sp. isolate Hart1]